MQIAYWRLVTFMQKMGHKVSTSSVQVYNINTSTFVVQLRFNRYNLIL